MRRILTAALAAFALAAPAAHAQVIAQGQVTVALDPDALPPPDPHAFWDEPWLKKPDATDPLGERRIRRGERPPALEIQNGVPPLLYRLWLLTPLQHQLVRRGEAVVEMWARPSETVRQAIVRVTLRNDGRAFVQGRAGMGCCEPEIAKLVAFDAELPPERAAAVRAILDDPLWTQPRMVKVVDQGMTLDIICVNGVSYDVSLVVAGGARSLHRSCSGEEIGSIAPVLTALLTAALGYDPRFDVVFPRGADFSGDREIYQALVARGGELQPARTNVDQPDLIPDPPPLPPEEPEAEALETPAPFPEGS